MPRILTLTLAAALAAGAAPLSAQSIFDSNLRTGPQYVRYEIKSPVGETISELAVPISVVVPFTPSFNIDVGSAYTSARVEETGSGGQTSTISGLTDTQIRGNLTLGTDFVTLTAGVNLPTGRETAALDQELAAFRIGNDFLSFPVSNMGTGLGFTGGLALARPMGEWNLGLGASMRRSSAYDPFEDNTGARPRFQPGNEYRARAGLDHPFGTGRVAFALTYAKFGDDKLAESIYNTGDRYIAEAGFDNSFGGADLLVTAWNLLRTPGNIYTGQRIGRENIANLLVGVGVRTMSGVLEPTLELRNWQQEHLTPSTLGTLGLRYTLDRGGYAITPSAGYTLGKFASPTGSADLTGFRAMLAIRLGS